MNPFRVLARAIAPSPVRLASILLLLLSGLIAAEPLRLDGGGPAPELLTDRMRILFDAFDERAVLGETPTSVTVIWDDFTYSLSAADYLAYREGERNFLQTVARVRIERTVFWSPRVLWRRYWWAFVGLGVLLILALLMVLMLRRRRKGRHAASAYGTGSSHTTAGNPAVAQPPSFLCLYPLGGSPHPLLAECTTIGSQEGNLLRLSIRGIAPHHARIWRMREGTWFVEDLGSPFGTFVNGQPVTRQWLQAGAILGVGEWQARVEWSQPNAAIATQPVASRLTRQ